jgi:hypothetical protein
MLTQWVIKQQTETSEITMLDWNHPPFLKKSDQLLTTREIHSTIQVKKRRLG